MSEDLIINIARDFTPFPGGRHYEDGPYSGERFLQEHLLPSIRRAEVEGSHVVISIDGVAGLPPSFLEEAFGGLLRSGEVTLEEALRLIRFQAKTPRVSTYPTQIEDYMRAAAA
ncbi:STAS-like domain-containing protein [Labrys sp. LIt4]|uniref:STAS-like domain-containing protein n=1 Tax=Labrys sp. LIt4 TaxID=2821355 RepID=UPI001AE0154C|nr:STAS-like domain-containing protein [Labrys sp. LIt4]MBP0581472.1 STAS-like domain-containing protein [Labrys sp. LIt4]